MKNLFIKTLVIALTFATGVATSRAGQEKGNGGDAIALEFIGLGRSLAKTMQSGRLNVPGVDPISFAAVIETVEVVTLEHTYLNGKELDAINYSSKRRIELSRSRWQEYGNDLNRKLSLALHEYLGVAEGQDRRYEHSTAFLEILNNNIPESLLWLVVLDAIDSICGDTWCEGDYNFRFESISCDDGAKTCKVGFAMIKEIRSTTKPQNKTVQSNGTTGKITEMTKAHTVEFAASCELPGFGQLNELVGMSDGGYVDLNDQFYDSMTDCIGALEKELAKIR